MIKTHSMLLEELKRYSAPGNKIMRMVQAGKLIPLTRGIYETNSMAPPEGLAASIYGPSYLSFEFALAYYELIPERVTTITSATFEKNRRKEFKNAFGVFTYRDVPSQVFPLELRVHKQGDYYFRIASAEKALCDQLYKSVPVSSVKQLCQLIFNDLRIDEAIFNNLDHAVLQALAPKYQRTNLRLLSKLLDRRHL